MKSKRYKIFIRWAISNENEDIGTLIEIPEECLIETLKNIVSPDIDRIEVFQCDDM